MKAQSAAQAANSDPLIDEVRANRGQLVEQFGNDLDRLAEHLRHVQSDYEERSGQFAKLPRHIAEEPYPTMTRPIADPTREEIRSLRHAVRRKARLRRR